MTDQQEPVVVADIDDDTAADVQAKAFASLVQTVEQLVATVAELEKAVRSPGSPPTQLATPMHLSAGFRSVAYSYRGLGEGEPPYVAQLPGTQ